MRCAAWKEATDDPSTPTMSELAKSVILLLGRGDPVKLAKQLANYRKSVPSFPELEACVAVESVLQKAKGEIYRAITKTEQDIRRELERRFGELPLQFDPNNKLPYNAAANTHEVEVTEGMTLQQFDYILNRRNLGSSELAAAIGRDNVKWQRIATLRRKAREGNKEPLPADIACVLVEGLNKLADKDIAPRVLQDTVASTTPTSSPKTDTREVATDALRVMGLGGLDISFATRLNLQDLCLEDGHGNILIKEKTLFIPPIPLTTQQQEAIRRWIAETVASKMV